MSSEEQFYKKLQSCIKGIHWLVLTNGYIDATQLMRVWQREFDADHGMHMLGVRSEEEIYKLLQTFPDAFTVDGDYVGAKEVSSRRAFKPSRHITDFLYARYCEWFNQVFPDASPRVCKERKRRADDDDAKEHEAKRHHPVIEEVEEGTAKVKAEFKSETLDMRKAYFCPGALILFDDDGQRNRTGKISWSDPARNEYIVSELDMPFTAQTVGKKLQLQDLRAPSLYSNPEIWESDHLPLVNLTTGSSCKVRVSGKWHDAELVNIFHAQEPPMYDVRLSSGQQIGSVPEHDVRRVPKPADAALSLWEFWQREKDAFEYDKKQQLKQAISQYELAGVELAKAEQHLAPDYADYQTVKEHRQQIIRRVQYLRKVLRSASAADKPLSNHIGTVCVGDELTELIWKLSEKADAKSESV